MDHESLVKARMEALRAKQAQDAATKQQQEAAVAAAKEAQRLKEEAMYNDAMIDCEAKVALYLESITDSKIINDFTEDKTPETYITEFCKSLDATSALYILGLSKDKCWYSMCMLGDSYHYNRTLGRTLLTPQEFKIKKNTTEFRVQYIYKYIMKLIEPIHQERMRLRKEKEEFSKRQRIQAEIDETNSLIMKRLVNVPYHTFMPLTLADYNTLNTNDFLCMNMRDGICIWAHYNIGIRAMNETYSGMSPSFESYYESGKVPFLTKCPTCQSPTKFNYLHKTYSAGGFGCSNSTNSNTFTEVYCDNHYWYDSTTKTHYISSPDGKIMETPKRPNIGAWNYSCWGPKGYFKQSQLNAPSVYVGSKWKLWNPNDPDGKKAAEEKKHAEIIKYQEEIEKLQAKLAELRSST